MPQFIMPLESAGGRSAFAALDAFTQGYVEALFWTETGTADDADLANASFEDLSPAARARIRVDCLAFQGDCAASLTAAAAKDSSRTATAAGHDFWLTRNGHGAGFWDGDWPAPEATILDRAAKEAGECSLYRGDDGLLYLS